MNAAEQELKNYVARECIIQETEIGDEDTNL